MNARKQEGNSGVGRFFAGRRGIGRLLKRLNEDINPDFFQDFSGLFVFV